MAQVWQTPIFDRTRKDVEFAIGKIAEWIANKSSDIYDLKGCLNVSDINRIEGNIAYLAEHLTELHYPPDVSTRKWTQDSLPTEKDVERIINNVRACVDAFYQVRNAPTIPSSMLSYNNINDIEKNLDLIKYLLDIMVSSFKKSGTFQSGASRVLPIRR